MTDAVSVRSGLGLLVGAIVGAGMFALPHVIIRAGVVWGIFHGIVAFLVITALHFLYGRIIFLTPGVHRLPGYARLYLGNAAGAVSFLSTLLGFYGALLAYGILGGLFLRNITGLDAYALSIMFYGIGATALLFGLRNIGTLNFILTIPLILLVVFLFILAFPFLTIAPLWTASRVLGEGIPHGFLAYGVALFAFTGLSVIPDVAGIFRRDDGRLFRRVLLLGTLIPLALYAVFVATVLGVSGPQTSRDAILGLRAVLGEPAVVVGSLIGLLAVFTSFLALGTDLKNIYRYDYGWSKEAAWLMVSVAPLILFLAGFADFIGAIGFVGGVAIGIDGVIILAMARKLEMGQAGTLLLLFGALAVGIAYELYNSIV